MKEQILEFVYKNRIVKQWNIEMFLNKSKKEVKPILNELMTEGFIGRKSNGDYYVTLEGVIKIQRSGKKWTI